MWRWHTLLIQQTFSLISVLTVSIRNTYTYEFKFNCNPVYVLYEVIAIKIIIIIIIIIINRLPSNILIEHSCKACALWKQALNRLQGHNNH